jgi:hypothetical protein
MLLEAGERKILRRLLLCLALGACSSGDSPPAARATSRYMLEQAAGAYLGMSWRELQKVRPGVWNDSGLLAEPTDDGENLYLFRIGSGQPTLGRTSGVLAIVLMHPKVPPNDSSAYRRRIAEIRARWTALAGEPADSLVQRVPARGPFPERAYHVLVWKAPDAVLSLSYDAGPAPWANRRPELLATVQLPDIPVNAGTSARP